MGKKNKKSRRCNDDDILLGPPSNHDLPEPEDDDVDVAPITDDGDAPTAVTDAENTPSSNLKTTTTGDDDAPTADAATDSEDTSSVYLKTTKEQAKQKDVNIDLIKLEETITEILLSYSGNYQSEDWLYRTIEKNMHLPKHSLKKSLDANILEHSLARVEQNVQQLLEQKDYNEMNKKTRWDDLVAEMCDKSELTEEDEAKLRREAGVMGVDPDAAVAMVVEKNQQKDGGETGREGDVDHEQHLGDASASFSVSILLALQPYIQQLPSYHSSFGKIFCILRQYICLFLYNILSLLLGKQATVKANQIWDQIHLPSIKAAQLAQAKEEDERMLQENTHLWSNQEQYWLKKNASYLPPLTENAFQETTIPPTIRWNTTRKQWERWSKNLTTRTKAMKQAAATGLSTSFTKGTFVPVRAGEGWATAPDQPEVDTEQIVAGGIHFFVCLPTETGKLLEVIDVTAWATKTVLKKEAARELEAVDSGKELFSLDVSTLLLDKKSGKKGKGGKNIKKKRPNKDESVDQGEDEGNSAVRKGVGCTARVSDRYLDRL
mmetsp:Transcript_416/g.802  ORF Transcript_416/g.802 Transcript_416/m.802 type:complete len:548 (+) Transcript_416:58-1701(+)